METKLKQILKEQGRSLTWLHDQTMIGYTTLLNYKNGKTNISGKNLVLISSKLNVEPKDLI